MSLTQFSNSLRTRRVLKETNDGRESCDALLQGVLFLRRIRRLILHLLFAAHAVLLVEVPKDAKAPEVSDRLNKERLSKRSERLAEHERERKRIHAGAEEIRLRVKEDEREDRVEPAAGQSDRQRSSAGSSRSPR